MLKRKKQSIGAFITCGSAEKSPSDQLMNTIGMQVCEMREMQLRCQLELWLSAVSADTKAEKTKIRY